MKWIILPFPDSYFEETKYMSVKFYQFSCIREYYLTNSIRKCVLIVYNLSATFLPNLRLMRPLSLMFDLCLSVDNKKAVLLDVEEKVNPSWRLYISEKFSNGTIHIKQTKSILVSVLTFVNKEHSFSNWNFRTRNTYSYINDNYTF